MENEKNWTHEANGISRRTFVGYALVSLGGAALQLVPRFAYGAEPAISALVAGSPESSSLNSSLIVALGSYPMAILGAIDRELLNRSEEWLESNHWSEDVDGVGLASIVGNAEMNDATIIDVGEIEKDPFTSLENDSDSDNTCRYLDGSLKGLPGTFRFLGEITGRKHCEDFAVFYEDVNSVVSERLAAVQEFSPRRIYVGCGHLGLAYETFRYFGAHVFPFLNATCINNDIGRNLLFADSETVDLRAVRDARPDVVLLRDSFRLYEQESGFLDRIWNCFASDCEVLYVPNDGESWLGSPLIAQGLGLLWLGKKLYPSIYDIDLNDFEYRYRNLLSKKD